jgi:hypothetical protein
VISFDFNITYTHDGFGNVLTETDWLNHPTTIDYETDSVLSASLRRAKKE